MRTPKIITAILALIESALKGRGRRHTKGQNKPASSDRATPKQMGMIRGLCCELGLNLRFTCKSEMKCWPDQLTKSTASAFIKILQAKAAGDEQTDAPNAPPPTVSGLDATPKQKGMIRAMCHQLNFNADEQAQSAHQKPLDQLTKKEASSLIDALKEMRQETAVAAR